MFKSFSLYHKIALLLSLVLLMTGTVFWTIQWRKDVRLTDLQNQLDSSVRQVQQLQGQIGKRITPPDLPAMSRSIPKEWDISLFFADLTIAARESNVTIRNVSPVKPSGSVQNQQAANGQTQQSPSGQTRQAGNGVQSTGNGQSAPPAELKGISSIDFAIEASGEANQLLIFLDRLHKMPRLAWVKSYDLQLDKQGQTNGSPGNAQASINLTIYAQSPWDDVQTPVQWPFSIQPAGNEKAFGR